MELKFLGKQNSWWLTLLLTATLSVTSIILVYSFLRSQTNAQNSSSTPPETRVELNAVSALGHLEPKGEVIHLSAPASTTGARVDQLLVKQGDKVQPEQVIAILDSRNQLEAALKKSQKQVSVVQARLEQIKAGAKKGEINAQKAKIEGSKAELRGQVTTQQAIIERLKAELQGEQKAQEATISRLKAQWQNAKTECDRYQQLYQDGAVAASQHDLKCLEEKTAQERVNEAEVNLNRIVTTRGEQIAEAKATLQRTTETVENQVASGQGTLDQIAEVRTVDVAVTQAELEDALAAVQQAKAQLDLAYVRSPKAGQILKIHTWPGEIISNKGIVELGRTEQMYAIAEVYETDISKVRLGQQATITSTGFTKKLQGIVEEIGLQVGKKDVLGTDPVADVDARVVEVKIRLNPTDSKLVAGLTNLKVKLVIDTSNSR
ncbi:MAG: ABC exporter membrane fusion protein [Potamolinea sp.]